MQKILLPLLFIFIITSCSQDWKFEYTDDDSSSYSYTNAPTFTAENNKTTIRIIFYEKYPLVRVYNPKFINSDNITLYCFDKNIVKINKAVFRYDTNRGLFYMSSPADPFVDTNNITAELFRNDELLATFKLNSLLPLMRKHIDASLYIKEFIEKFEKIEIER